MKYTYQRPDAGIPGLPHEITDEQAEESGLTDLLQQAIAAGAYKSEPETPPARPERKKKSEVANE